MPYAGMTHNVEVTGISGYPECPEPPKAKINDNLNEAMAILKELLIALQDAHIALYGEQAIGQTENETKLDCMYEVSMVLNAQAHIALDRFLEIKRKLY